MTLKLTSHAKLRIKARKIEKGWIKKVISNPILTDSDSKDQNVIHYYGKIDGQGKKVLRVIGKNLNGDILIITAFFDRGMRGKL